MEHSPTNNAKNSTKVIPKKENIILENKEYTKAVDSIEETHKPVLSELTKLIEQNQTGEALTES